MNCIKLPRLEFPFRGISFRGISLLLICVLRILFPGHIADCCEQAAQGQKHYSRTGIVSHKEKHGCAQIHSHRGKQAALSAADMQLPLFSVIIHKITSFPDFRNAHFP